MGNYIQASGPPIMSCLRAAAIMAVGILAAIFFVDLCHTHVFEPEVLQKLANEAIEAHGTNISAIVVDLVDRLSKVPGYGSHMTAKQEWIFNNAGGAMGLQRRGVRADGLQA